MGSTGGDANEPIVLMAGAGVSMAPPSSLPGWYALARKIADVLSERLIEATGEFGALPSLVARLEGNRSRGRLPPDYQAQLIQEMAGTRYFEALQSLDVDAANEAHEAIAWLAQTGRLVAIVTTNFDRMIEQALERRGAEFCAFFDELGFAALAARGDHGKAPLPLIKVHGSVTSAESMIDTLKQRRRGRSNLLRECLDRLPPARWIFAGFSAADLETDPEYLGFVDRATKSRGAIFIRHRGSVLGPGAALLKSAYGDNWSEVEEEVATFLDREFGHPPRPPEFPSGPGGEEQFRERLRAWADTLPPPAAALCLAALFEASGEGEIAAKILDRIVRHSPQSDRVGDDYAACQLHYGRIAAAWGRYTGARDMNGGLANAAVEGIQSLLRIGGTRYDFAASSWVTTALLWTGNGRQALSYARGLVRVVGEEDSGRSDEELADAWIAAAQAFIIDGGSLMHELLESAATALAIAARAGDVVRSARVAALHLLSLAHTNADLIAQDRGYGAIFEDSRRIHDGVAAGIRELALGRWLVGLGGHAERAAGKAAEVALRALDHFVTAAVSFDEQVLDPWIAFLEIQRAKALADLGDLEQAGSLLASVEQSLSRFPILEPHLFEAGGQIRLLIGDDPRSDFTRAIDAATRLGLPGREELMRSYLRPRAEPPLASTHA